MDLHLDATRLPDDQKITEEFPQMLPTSSRGSPDRPQDAQAAAKIASWTSAWTPQGSKMMKSHPKITPEAPNMAQRLPKSIPRPSIEASNLNIIWQMSNYFKTNSQRSKLTNNQQNKTKQNNLLKLSCRSSWGRRQRRQPSDINEYL